MEGQPKEGGREGGEEWRQALEEGAGLVEAWVDQESSNEPNWKSTEYVCSRPRAINVQINKNNNDGGNYDTKTQYQIPNTK